MIVSVRVPPEKRIQINGWIEREREIERNGLHDSKVSLGKSKIPRAGSPKE